MKAIVTLRVIFLTDAFREFQDIWQNVLEFIEQELRSCDWLAEVGVVV